MSDTTKRIEELREMAKSLISGPLPTMFATAAIALAESLAAELAAIRGAGDEEVEDHIKTVKCLWHMLPEFSYAVNMLRDIAISRGQQLAAARKRVEELEGEIRLRDLPIEDKLKLMISKESTDD